MHSSAVMRDVASQHGIDPDTEFKLSRCGLKIAVRVIGARTAAGSAPLLLYFHGGMFNNGTLEDSNDFAAALSSVAVVASVDYPLAPYVRFPDTPEVAYAALRWAASMAERFGADHKRIFIAGEQAGGNLAAVTALIARDRAALKHLPHPLAGQLLLSPLLDPHQSSPSMRASIGQSYRQGWSAYLPPPVDTMHPYATPLYSRRLGRLPKTLIITSENDPLRNEAETYAAALVASGNPIQIHRLKTAITRITEVGHPDFPLLLSVVTNFIGVSEVDSPVTNLDYLLDVGGSDPV